jgi:hypothetical protein
MLVCSIVLLPSVLNIQSNHLQRVLSILQLRCEMRFTQENLFHIKIAQSLEHQVQNHYTSRNILTSVQL